MEAPSSTLNRNSRPLRPKRRGLESGLMESHRTTHPYDYESLLRASRQAPTDTTTSPSYIIAVDGPKARKYRDLSDPRRHKSPALPLRPPQAASRLQRRNPPPTYPYDASPVSLWPSRDPIGERGGLNLYGMVGNDSVGRSDYLGLAHQAGQLLDITGGQDQENPRPFDPDAAIGIVLVFTDIDTSECCKNSESETGYASGGSGCTGNVKITFGFFYYPLTEHQQNAVGQGPGQDDFNLDLGWSAVPEIHFDNNGGGGPFSPIPEKVQWNGEVNEDTNRRTALGSVMSVMKTFEVPCAGGEVERSFVMTNGVGERSKWRPGRAGLKGPAMLTGGFSVSIGECGKIISDKVSFDQERNGNLGLFNENFKPFEK